MSLPADRARLREGDVSGPRRRTLCLYLTEVLLLLLSVAAAGVFYDDDDDDDVVAY